MENLRIVLADDHTLFRQGLRRVLEEQPGWQVIADASDGATAVRLTLERQPHVVIMDIAMPRLNGVEATRQIVRRAPDVRVLILSMYSDDLYITQALQAGAHGFVLKDSADADLVRAVRDLAAGKSYFSPTVSKVVLDDYVRHLADRGISDRFDALTEREREVFQLIAEGHSNKDIAGLLHLSPGTVETHRARIMEKLDLHSAAEIVLYAVRKGVIR
ncbi:MAG TPA: response regulator transcription factor [Vicinamibacterales bacterium]|jgi:two-component system, NarL family, response regulator NreC|nr:response regulator transcription factor [Vicinamibacterales bacterium]